MTRLYCPHCRLELSGNTHKKPAEAWNRFECEYDTRQSDISPVTELEIKKEALLKLLKDKERMAKNIEKLEQRIQELEAMAGER